MKSCFPVLVLPLAGEVIASAIQIDAGPGVQHKSCTHEEVPVHSYWHHHTVIAAGGHRP